MYFICHLFGSKILVQHFILRQLISLDETAFEIITPQSAIIIRTKDEKEKTQWMTAIKDQIKALFKESEDHRYAEFTFTTGDNYKGYLLWGKVSFLITLIEFGDSILLLYVADPQHTVKVSNPQTQ
jgi:hypothetical protein